MRQKTHQGCSWWRLKLSPESFTTTKWPFLSKQTRDIVRARVCVLKKWVGVCKRESDLVKLQAQTSHFPDNPTTSKPNRFLSRSAQSILLQVRSGRTRSTPRPKLCISQLWCAVLVASLRPTRPARSPATSPRPRTAHVGSLADVQHSRTMPSLWSSTMTPGAMVADQPGGRSFLWDANCPSIVPSSAVRELKLWGSFLAAACVGPERLTHQVWVRLFLLSRRLCE